MRNGVLELNGGRAIRTVVDGEFLIDNPVEEIVHVVINVELMFNGSITDRLFVLRTG